MSELLPTSVVPPTVRHAILSVCPPLIRVRKQAYRYITSQLNHANLVLVKMESVPRGYCVTVWKCWVGVGGSLAIVTGRSTSEWSWRISHHHGTYKQHSSYTFTPVQHV